MAHGESCLQRVPLYIGRVAKICSPGSSRSRQPITGTSEHVRALKALAHPHRLQVFLFLVKASGPVPVNDLLKALKLPGPTLSHHLDDLEHAGLITRMRRERFIYSSVRTEMVEDLVRLLTACC